MDASRRDRELPPGASAGDDAQAVTRRTFLRVMSSGLALATGGCFQPPREKILPYTARPLDVTPGIASFYATTMVVGGFGTGLLVESHEGRPTKIEGNPDHPASLGAAGVFEQASVLQLYDPDRLSLPRRRSGIAGWDAFAREFAHTPATTGQGRGLHFLLEPTASPLTSSLIDRIRTTWPGAGFTFYSPLVYAGAMDGARIAFGRPLQAVYDFTHAGVIVALDADFLDDGAFNLRYAREFADGRRVRTPADPMNRLYVAESAFTPTGGMADDRVPVRASDITGIAMALLAEVAGPGAPLPVTQALARWRTQAGAERFGSDTSPSRWVRAAAADLRALAGRGIVIVGEGQPAAVHAIAFALNAMLGNMGRTIRMIEPLLPAGDPVRAISALAAAIDAGAVQKLVILGGNPSYTAPSDLRFGQRIRTLEKSVYVGLYHNETARDCDWVLPELHYLEAWGDARAFDGTASIVQPLIRPLYDGRTVDEVLAICAGMPVTDGYSLVRESWRTRMPPDFELGWVRALERGVIENTASPTVTASFDWARVLPALAVTAPGDNAVELTFRRDPRVLDGRFANNPWLQELPHPVLKLTWDNAAHIGSATAKQFGVDTGDEITVELGGVSLNIPAIVVPGHAESSITLPLGYGRSGEETVARGVGVNVYPLRTTGAPYVVDTAGVRAGSPAAHRRLATTQDHFTMEGRPIARGGTLGDYRADPARVVPPHRKPVSLYEPVHQAGEQWAMTIDLGVCTGCSACVVACQAENNIPVVGRDGVLKSREMHWLRIDRYYFGPPEHPDVVSQPMLCQHCEKAPCEYVCPVNATVHSPDGLNEMVYNRCVGTRFCSNNCPYKVRRFNWFDYSSGIPDVMWMQHNPDVTVRERGVMEKCTYCVQRIRRAEIRAASEARAIRADEVVTACQQACPTRAIVFGSLSHPESEVVRSRGQPRSYAVLDELGTEPRTRYLARITNPSSAIAV